MLDFGKRGFLHEFDAERNSHVLSSGEGSLSLALDIYKRGGHMDAPFSFRGPVKEATRGEIRELLAAGETVARKNHAERCGMATQNQAIIGECRRLGWKDEGMVGPLWRLVKELK